MENVVLTVHLILAVLLTGVVLLQRSEGGGLGVGGGSGVMTGRQAANALTRLTWIFGVALFVTSISLTIIAARQSSNSSILDQMGVPASQQNSSTPSLPSYTPPPSTGGDPLTPPAPDAAAPAAPAAEAPAVATPDVAAPATEAPAATAPATEAPAADVVAPEAAAPEAQQPAPAN